MAFLLTRWLSTLLQEITTTQIATAPSARSAQSTSAGTRNHLLARLTPSTQIRLHGQRAPIKSLPISRTPMIELQRVLR